MRFENIKAYQDYFINLVEKERFAEKKFHLEEIKRLNGNERQKRGRAVLGLRMKYTGEFLDFKIYRFNRNNFPNHQIKTGDIVLISKGEPLKISQEAVVSAVGKNFIEIYSKEAVFRSRLYRIDLFVNDITFKRMIKTLENLKNSEFDYEIILGKKEPKICEINKTSANLNESQNIALKKAINSDMFLIHGPPGTGKTTTLAEIIKKHIGKKILVCADSNVAVDNLLEKLQEYNVLRIGHPVKIESNLMKYSLDVKVRRDKKYKEIEKIIKKITDLKHLQEKKYKKPTPGRKRGMNEEEILEFAKQNKTKRGIKPEWILEMAEWIKIQRSINKLYDNKNKIMKNIIEDVLEKADIIFATNSSAAGEFLKTKKFDIVFIDEAAQAVEPSALIPLTKAKQAVFAGDHKQLPPTILSNDDRLKTSMFERFTKIYKNAYHTLDIQYRMNAKINKFTSCEFYECRVKTFEKIKNINITDLNIALSDEFGGKEPVVFFDTDGKFIESSKKGSFSKYNPLEAEFVVKLINLLKNAGAENKHIGVITPYKDHEEYIKKILNSQEFETKNLEVKSVDGFQGREKEIIILSLVRANEKEKIGFLNDLRRLNVSLTRAKRKLIIIGNSKTLSSHKIYKKLIEYIKKNGIYKKIR